MAINVTRNFGLTEIQQKQWIIKEIEKICQCELSKFISYNKKNFKSIQHFLLKTKKDLLLRQRISFSSTRKYYFGQAVNSIDNLIKTGEENNKVYDKIHRNWSATFWPNHEVNNHEKLEKIMPFALKFPFVTKQTKIASAGSCFAIEIAKHLQIRNFKYIVTEHWGDSKLTSYSSARWGIIFNTPSFRQLVQKAFGVIQLPRIYWQQNVNGTMKVYDPFREDVIYESIEEYERDQEIHLANCHKVFKECELFIFTLGMNEIWRLAGSKFVFSRSPWQTAGELIEKKFLTVAENVRELQDAIDLVRKHNPNCKFIFSVSPVPLHATFDTNRHVVESNTLSKSILRVAVEQLCDPKRGIFYFPAYEYVVSCAKNPWQKDERHVNSETISVIMDMFEAMFVKPQY